MSKSSHQLARILVEETARVIGKYADTGIGSASNEAAMRNLATAQVYATLAVADAIREARP